MKSCMQPLAVLVAAVSLCAAGADALPKFPGKRTVEFANPVNPIVPEGLFFCDPAARVGPDGTLWVFYTNTFNYNHIYERRISMDPVGINEDGELYCPAATEFPQF
ncbi:MAG: hypothetical protein IJC66_10125, partial [Kiritimatiellae bacterium]|nr:hypothetical protein [Kiritimatiellia bacterium]